MFTINRLGLPPREVPGLDLIDSTHSGVRQKTRRVTHWKNGQRWPASVTGLETTPGWVTS